MSGEAAETMTDQEASDYRQEFAQEVYGEDVEVSAAPAPEDLENQPNDLPEKPIENEPDPDPWEGVSPVLKQQFESMQAKLDGIGEVGERLKQAEKRIGSLTNTLHNANQAAEDLDKKNKDAPTEAEIEAASKSQEKWDALKDDFPEWAEAVDAKFAAENAELKKTTEGIETRIKALETSGAAPEEVANLRREFNENFVELKHAGWKETVNTEEFKTFFQGLDADTKALADSQSPIDTIKVLDLFTEHQNPTGKRTAAQIAADRKARLKSSVSSPSGRKRTVAKSENDMTDEEYRQKAASEVWTE